jgi:hypothetical protein
MSKSPRLTKLGSEFTAEVYRGAARERTDSLQALYDGEMYVLACYVSGVAVECMFRAYRMRARTDINARHDLHELARESNFEDRVPSSLFAKFESDLTIVATRWNNNHRYRSDETLRKYFKRAHLDRGIKGDFVKENVRKMLNAANDIIVLGDRLWHK